MKRKPAKGTDKYRPNTCPKCRRVQYFTCGDHSCPCWTGIPKGKLPQVRLDHGALACPYCGFEEGGDFWAEMEMTRNSYPGDTA
jgi:hypothetical protein